MRLCPKAAHCRIVTSGKRPVRPAIVLILVVTIVERKFTNCLCFDFDLGKCSGSTYRGSEEITPYP